MTFQHRRERSDDTLTRHDRRKSMSRPSRARTYSFCRSRACYGVMAAVCFLVIQLGSAEPADTIMIPETIPKALAGGFTAILAQHQRELQSPPENPLWNNRFESPESDLIRQLAEELVGSGDELAGVELARAMGTWTTPTARNWSFAMAEAIAGRGVVDRAHLEAAILLYEMCLPAALTARRWIMPRRASSKLLEDLEAWAGIEPEEQPVIDEEDEHAAQIAQVMRGLGQGVNPRELIVRMFDIFEASENSQLSSPFEPLGWEEAALELEASIGRVRTFTEEYDRAAMGSDADPCEPERQLR